MKIILDGRKEKIWQNLPKLFKLSEKYDHLIAIASRDEPNEHDLSPKHLTTLLRMQKRIHNNILRLTKMLVAEKENYEVNSTETP